ncbi:hypothetical protein GGQ02_001762 [Salinibacter ruber]|nr:hypothetical protein [Salinibacter ruber]
MRYNVKLSCKGQETVWKNLSRPKRPRRAQFLRTRLSPPGLRSRSRLAEPARKQLAPLVSCRNRVMAHNAPTGLNLLGGSLASLPNGGHDFLSTDLSIHRRDIKGRSVTLAWPNDVLTPIAPANPNLSLLSGLVQQISKILTGLRIRVYSHIYTSKRSMSDSRTASFSPPSSVKSGA